MSETESSTAQAVCPSCEKSFTPLESPAGGCPECLMRLGLDATIILTHAGEAIEEDRVPPPPEVISDALPDYEIHELLGYGGMGAVYKATHRRLHRSVAIKVLLPRWGTDRTFTERFLREAQTLAGLNHPGIVTVYDFGVAEGQYFFAMEYVDGISLRELIRKEGPLEREHVFNIISQLCDALHYAHDKGVVHRDIKPDNILVDREGTVHVSDFGLAKLLARKTSADQHLTQSHQVMGTPHYMAPEQIEQPLEVDHRADLYALGVVLYELLTQELPLGHFTPPSKKSGTDARLDVLVLRALEKEPSKRIQRAIDFKSQITRIRETKENADAFDRIEKALNRSVHVTRRAFDDARNLYQRAQVAGRTRSLGRNVVQDVKIASQKAREWMNAKLKPLLNDLRHQVREKGACFQSKESMRQALAQFWHRQKGTVVVIRDEQRGLRLHPRFVQDHGLIPDTAHKIDTVLLDLFRRYVDMEIQKSELQKTTDGQFAVRIHAFPEELESLGRELRARIDSVTDRIIAQKLFDCGLSRQVFAYGRTTRLIPIPNLTKANLTKARTTTHSHDNSGDDTSLGKSAKEPLPALFSRFLEDPDSVPVREVDDILY